MTVRVIDHLRERDIEFEVLPHARTFTSIEEALALGISAGDVAKTLLLDTKAGHVAVVVPASRRLDMRLVREAVDDPGAALATEGEIRHDLPEMELGSLPPIPSILGVPVYVDPELLAHREIVFAGGTQTQSIKARTEDVLRGEDYVEAPLTRHPEEAGSEQADT